VGRKCRPLTCKDVKRILRALGFEPDRQKGSHEQWMAKVRDRMHLVTVDCPKEPFVAPLLTRMVHQSGYSIDEWYKQLEK